MKNFPNTFEDWQESHFEIVQAITIEHIKKNPIGVVKERHESQGHGGLWELAKELTDEFELKYKDVQWGEGDEIEYFDIIKKFIKEKLYGNL